MEIRGNPWKSVEIRGNPWKSVEIHGYPWKSLEIRGKFQQALKLAENLEKQGFTFFAFLPSYIDISGSPIDRSQRDLSVGIENSSFHAIWLGIEPLLCFLDRF